MIGSPEAWAKACLDHTMRDEAAEKKAREMMEEKGRN